MNQVITKEAILREIPVINGEHGPRVRPAFRDLHRVVASQTLSKEDLDFFYREVLERKKALEMDRQSSASRRQIVDVA